MAAPALSVHHLAVVVRDLDRAAAFYRDLLGLREIRRWDDAEGAPRSVWLELGGGAFLAVEKAPRDAPDVPREAHAILPGWHCVALGIAPSERAAWRARLAAGGVEVERESAYTLYIRDPEHNLVALSHYPAAEVA